MKQMFVIKDDSANQVVSIYFIANSTIEAIRQFRGYLLNNKIPCFASELSLVKVANLDEDGRLLCEVTKCHYFTNEQADEFVTFPFQHICKGNEIDQAYITYSGMSEEDYNKFNVQKNVTESEFDEIVKNGNR